MSRLRTIPLFVMLALLGGCHFVVMDPSGDVAAQQRNLVVISTILMLLIIIPVIALTIVFAWRYRRTNAAAIYEPNWDHSTLLELVIWAAPLMIVICLGAITWTGTHLLDPYRQIGRISSRKAMPYTPDPIEVDVVALDWKWLFIYPQYGIATVNDLAAPVDRPIDFHITSSSVMNSFYIPALAGQIYAMPGMETRLHGVINMAGDYRGFSANYSGAGFSGMHFTFHGVSASGFDDWVAKAKAGGGALDADTYLALEHPSQNEPVHTYASFTPKIYDKILNMCVEPGKMCANDMAMIDAKGGLGLAGINNVIPLEYDKFARRGAILAGPPSMVASICTTADPFGTGKANSRAVTGGLPLAVPAGGTGLTPVAVPRAPNTDANPAASAPLHGHALPHLGAVPEPTPAASFSIGPMTASNS